MIAVTNVTRFNYFKLELNYSNFGGNHFRGKNKKIR